MIRVDAAWMAVARAVVVFGAVRPHHACLFTKRRTNRLMVLVRDGIGAWLEAPRPNSDRFVWAEDVTGRLTRRSCRHWRCSCGASTSVLVLPRRLNPWTRYLSALRLRQLPVWQVVVTPLTPTSGCLTSGFTEIAGR